METWIIEHHLHYCQKFHDLRNKMKKRILITIPRITLHGGVTAFYKAVLPHMIWNDIIIEAIETGSRKGRRTICSIISDQLKISKKLFDKPSLLHVNPSLKLKAFLRDGLLVLLAKYLKIPVLVFWHGWDKNFEKIIDRRYRWLFRILFGNADRFIVLGIRIQT